MPLTPRSSPEKLRALSVWHRPAKVWHRTQPQLRGYLAQFKALQALGTQNFGNSEAGIASIQNPGILESPMPT